MTTEKDLTFAPSRRTFKIHVGKYGGIRVDAGEFFADPKDQNYQNPITTSNTLMLGTTPCHLRVWK